MVIVAELQKLGDVEGIEVEEPTEQFFVTNSMGGRYVSLFLYVVFNGKI